MSAEGPSGAQRLVAFVAGGALGCLLGAAAGVGAYGLTLVLPAERAAAFGVWRAQTFRYTCPLDAAGPYEHPATGWPFVCVPVFVHDVPAGTTVTARHLEGRLLPPDFVPDAAVLFPVGRTVSQRVLSGEFGREERLGASP